ncbi:nitrilase-related carbon-nitrogen hydrolase [Kribbella shirazensis]|uniref:Putative amidohydrolase n=1 Tax=Kribbella shirazensis TaxID=1105143 RepID=A0A7X5VHV3_9ACTN|nr:nitrilase-related carbon-nitrogen hydrolase [Kribbella shirazensis]NIK61575.1 putative amidohydrolase [Kribbella shirazensis]
MEVRVAACQIEARVDSPDPAVAVAAVRQAADAGARLIVLPEQAVSGYCFADADEALAAAEPLDGPTVQLLRSLSAELGCVLVAGYCERGESGRIYDSAVVVDAGEVLQNYRKVHLWGREAEWFTPGSRPPSAVDTRAGRVAVMICYDLEFPEFARLAALDGADIIAAPCNWPLLPRPATERPLELIKAQASAGTNKVHIVVADRCGPERGTDWIGGSAVIDASGYLLADAATPYGETARPVVLTADLDTDTPRDKSLGPHNNAFTDRRPTLYTGLT